MTTQFYRLTQANLHASHQSPPEANIISFSKLYQGFFRQSFRGFSIKYVLDGEETYVVNGREHRVRAGEYLLTNPHCHGTGLVDSPTAVMGLCVDIRPAVMAEVMNVLRHPGEPDTGCDLAGFLQAGDFYEHRFPAATTRLGEALARFGQSLRQSEAGTPSVDPSFMYTLTELYIDAYRDISRQMAGMAAVKTSTRHELHRRLVRGKEFMEACFHQGIDIEDVARHAQLSKYHFFRLFKAVYGRTPHQFIVQKRLNLGHTLLLAGHNTVSDIALQTGFADIFSFSKAFKKQFGMSPSALLGKPQTCRI